MANLIAAAAEDLAQQSRAGLRRALRWSEGPQEAWLQLEGRRVLSLCSNDYLGLASHPALRNAAADAAIALGVGAGASRLISGSMRIHRRLEERLAEFEQTEAALLFPSGYQANIGAITALVGPRDEIFSDELNHASIIDGCRLSRARVHVYPHGDLEVLAAALARSTARRKLVVSDGVFSMDGDLAPLPQICDLAERHGAMVMIDEAHGTGVLGAGGAGAAEHLGVSQRVDVKMITLGKALGAAGAAVCGSRVLVDLLVNRARSFIYTTAAPPPVTAAALAAVDLVVREPERRTRLAAVGRRLRRELAAAGYDVADGVTPIIPVHVGGNEEAVALSGRLLEEGVFVQAIRPPTVPPGTARLRVAVMATHTDADIAHAVAAFRAARGLLENIG